MSRTTPPRPVDVTAVFPQLAPLARTATRLHPRVGSPSPQDSSVGGPLLWPADEPWPHCDGPHELGAVYAPISTRNLKLTRQIVAAASGREMTPQENETFTRVRAAQRLSPEQVVRELRDNPTPLLPVAQLYVRDVPDLRAPAGADLLQVLWCPFDHPIMPRTELFWRSAATVTDILTTPPEPSAVQSSDYVPQPCLLHPEQVTEYPMELSKELREPLGNWDTWHAAGITMDNSDPLYVEEFYFSNLSVAPGWKVGGWASWGYTDPIPQFCPVDNTRMVPLLTIASVEWGPNNVSWVPYEDRASISATGYSYADPRTPTAVQIGDVHKQQLYICPADPEHPHTELMQ